MVPGRALRCLVTMNCVDSHGFVVRCEVVRRHTYCGDEGKNLVRGAAQLVGRKAAIKDRDSDIASRECIWNVRR